MWQGSQGEKGNGGAPGKWIVHNHIMWINIRQAMFQKQEFMLYDYDQTFEIRFVIA